MKRFLSLIMSFLLIYHFCFSQSQKYYIQREDQIALIHGNPKDIKPDYWQVWLRRCKGEGRWGIISGETAEEVMSELKSSQTLEKKICEESGRDCYPELCYSNPLGPIAIFKKRKTTPRLIEYYNNISKYTKDLRSLQKNYKKVIAYMEGKQGSPLSNVGKSLNEYLDNLKKVYGKLDNLHEFFYNADLLTEVIYQDKIRSIDIDNDIRELQHSKITEIANSINIQEGNDVTGSKPSSNNNVFFRNSEGYNKVVINKNIIDIEINFLSHGKDVINRYSAPIYLIKEILKYNSEKEIILSLESPITHTQIYPNGEVSNAYRTTAVPIRFSSQSEMNEFINRVIEKGADIEIKMIN